MEWTAYTTIFATAFTARFALETALDGAQLGHLRKRRDRVPKHLEGKVDLETVRRAVRYNIDKMRFGLFSRAFDGALMGASIAFGFALFDGIAAALFAPGVARGLAFFAVLGLVLGLLHLPLEAYAAFSLEARHGFNRRTPRVFVADKLKELLLGALLGGALLGLVLWLMGAAGDLFWGIAFSAVAAVQLFVAWIYPLAILPLFHKLKPVEGDLARDVGELANRVGFPLRGVVSMDGSRRSTHVNAFIVGLFGARRIVLYDTLIEKLDRPQLLAVLAHELGHYKRGHIRKRTLLGMLLLFALFAGLGAILGDDALALGMGFDAPSDHGALTAFFAITSEALFPFSFLGRVLSRRQELEADAFAVRNAGKEPLSSALVALSKQNLTSPGSAKIYRAYYNTHPALRERLAAIDALS